MSDILRDHGFSQTVGSDQNQIAGFLKEVQREGALDNVAVDFLGPVPVKVRHDSEASDPGTLQAASEGALTAIVAFHTDKLFQDHMWRPLGFGGARHEVVDGFGCRLQSELAKLLSQVILRT